MSGEAAAGAAAAAAAAQLIRQEEEEMTPYSREELAGDWEFKILRSMTNAFKKPATLNRVLEKEAQAGWVFVEKFDNCRIRLKRPVSAKKANPHVGFDPYRTYVGLSEGQYVLIVIACTLGIMLVAGALIVALAEIF